MQSSIKQRKTHTVWAVFGYCLLIAAGCLLICSKSSPLYPLNDWSDANIYFSMGKGMANGRVLYRDIYDHKGPLLYGIHALAYLLTPESFLGVWLFEILSAAFFLLGVWKILTLYGARESAVMALPVVAALIFVSLSFQMGDSAEEFGLPLLTWSLYAGLKYLRTEYPSPIPARMLVIQGVLCGSVLWIKFTMLGLHAVWILLAFFSRLLRKRTRDAFRTLGWFAVGVAITTLPWIAYFAWQGALLSWIKTYLYDNIFLYSGSGESLTLLARGKAIFRVVRDWVQSNMGYTLPMAFGLIWVTVSKRCTKAEKWAIWLLMAGTGLGVFISGKSYVYYGLILAVFTVLGFIPVCLWAEMLARKLVGFLSEKLQVSAWVYRASIFALTAAVSTLSFVGCYRISPNVSASFLMPKEKTMQYQFAAIMAETPDATLLNYGFMDAGFYTAAGITPHVKYFHQTNVPLQEMLDEQVRYITEGLCDYIVTRGREPASIHDHYELIAEADAPSDFWYEKVYLYRLKGLR